MQDQDKALTLEPLQAGSAIEQLNRSEIDIQIATAHRFPRTIEGFRRESKGMVGLSPEIAGECSYAIPRAGKLITGPSARFAEIIASCWGNNRAGARIIEENERFVVAQGVFHDLERNNAINYEVKRRITDRDGVRFSDDMIVVTSNAACSIAIRNAILKGVPKAFWEDIHKTAVATARGDLKSLPQRRKAAMESFGQMGITKPQVYELASVKGDSDIDLDKLFELSAILTAISDGDATKAEILSGLKATTSSPTSKPQTAPSMSEPSKEQDEDNGEDATDESPEKQTKRKSAKRKSSAKKAKAASVGKDKKEKPAHDDGEADDGASEPEPEGVGNASDTKRADDDGEAYEARDRDEENEWTEEDLGRDASSLIKEFINVISGHEEIDIIASEQVRYLSHPNLQFPLDKTQINQAASERIAEITGNSDDD